MSIQTKNYRLIVFSSKRTLDEGDTDQTIHNKTDRRPDKQTLAQTNKQTNKHGYATGKQIGCRLRVDNIINYTSGSSELNFSLY